MSQTIYTPQGKAREYSPQALNIYQGCDHLCWYCYVPTMNKRFKPLYDHSIVTPRKDLIKNLLRDAPKFQGSPLQVLLSFTGDPYCQANDTHRLTRQVLEVLLFHRIPVAILSKGGERMLQDRDLFAKFGKSIKIGATLVYLPREIDGPGAASPLERITALQDLKNRGIPTWVSFEPVIDPVATLNYLQICENFADHVKIGKLNHHPELERRINWSLFLRDAVELLRKKGLPFYIKQSLQGYADGLDLTSQEMDPDFMNAQQFSN